MVVVSPAYQERIVQFGEARGLVGILTLPSGERNPTLPHVVLLNHGILHRVGTNRLSVDLARALAGIGAVSLRFDLSGIGDSERRRDVGSVRESVDRDLAEVVDYMASAQGAERIAMMGVCAGAYDSLRGALHHEHVVGAVMIDLPGPFKGWRHTLHHLLARAGNLASWKNPLGKAVEYSRQFARDVAPALPVLNGDHVEGGRIRDSRERLRGQLGTVLSRGARLYFIFTGGLTDNYNHRSQFRTTFPQAARDPAVSFEYLPEADHTLSRARDREHVVRLAVEWLRREPFPGGR